MGNTTVTGGGVRPTSYFSSSSLSYRPSNSGGLSSGGFGGNGGSSGDSIDFTDFIVTPDEMDIYKQGTVTGSLGIEGAELPKPDTRPWYEKAWDSVKSVGATVVVGFTTVTAGVLDVVDDLADAGAYLAAGVCTAFGDEESAQWLREQAAKDLGDEFNDALYGEDGILKGVNEASYMKYDSDLAQGIRSTTKEATKFAAEVALTATTGGAGAALFGGLTAMGAAAENAYQNNGAQPLTLGENLRVLGAGAGGAVTGYFNGQMGLNALNGLKGIGSGSIRNFATNAWHGLQNFDWAAAGKAGLKTLGSGKTWGTAIGTSAEEIFNATANWVDTGEFNGDDWLAVGEHVVKSVGFQTVMSFGTSGIQGGNARYQQEQEAIKAQEAAAREAAERAELNRQLDNMTPEQRSQYWEEYYNSQYGAENVTHSSGIGVEGSNGSFVDPNAAAVNDQLERDWLNRQLDSMDPTQRSQAWEEYYNSQYGAENVTHSSGIGVEGSNGSFVDPEAMAYNQALEQAQYDKLLNNMKTYDNLHEICEKYGISEYEYLQMSRTPVQQLDPAARDTVLKVRMELTQQFTTPDGHIKPGTVIAKSITAEDFGKYYQPGGYPASVGGCVGLSQDIMALPDAESIVDSTGLRFTRNKFEVVSGDRSSGLNTFYIVEGQVPESVGANSPYGRVRISSTADYNPGNDAGWLAQSQGNVPALASGSGMSTTDITIENPSSYNRPFPGQAPAGYTSTEFNPDTGTGITLNQGTSGSLGVPEFNVANPSSLSNGSIPAPYEGARMPIVNGTIYQVVGNQKVPVMTIGPTGNITPYVAPTTP